MTAKQFLWWVDATLYVPMLAMLGVVIWSRITKRLRDYYTQYWFLWFMSLGCLWVCIAAALERSWLALVLWLLIGVSPWMRLERKLAGPEDIKIKTRRDRWWD